MTQQCFLTFIILSHILLACRCALSFNETTTERLIITSTNAFTSKVGTGSRFQTTSSTIAPIMKPTILVTKTPTSPLLTLSDITATISEPTNRLNKDSTTNSSTITMTPTTMSIPTTKTKLTTVTTTIMETHITEIPTPSVSPNDTIKLFKNEPVNKTEPKIMEITTKITDSVVKQEDNVYGPRIEGIEARFDPVKHAIPAKLKQKLDALSCDVPPLPSESTLWSGNETRDLLLPISVSVKIF